MEMKELMEDDWEELTKEELDDLERPDHGQYAMDYEPLWSEVLPGLWQGGTGDGEDIAYGHIDTTQQITEKDFDTVVTLYASALPPDWFVKEIRLGIYDSDMKDFVPEQLFDLVRVAHTDWKNKNRVLIRCQAGWNRSGLVMALVLMREGYTAEDAIALIRKERSQFALCNSDFEKFLLEEDAEKWRGETYGNPE
jgi:hypothetical protein